MLMQACDLHRFAESAQPGDQAAYGRGCNPPGHMVTAMRDLVDQGILAPVRKREGDGFLFMVQRGSGALSRPPLGREVGPSRGKVRRRQLKRSSVAKVMQCLTAAAALNQPCPSNDAIAKRCGLSGKDAARYRVNALVSRGRIAIEDRGPLRPRVVTILTGNHAGKSTRD